MKTTLCSSVHTNDSALATFFGAAGAKNDAKGTALVRRGSFNVLFLFFF